MLEIQAEIAHKKATDKVKFLTGLLRTCLCNERILRFTDFCFLWESGIPHSYPSHRKSKSSLSRKTSSFFSHFPQGKCVTQNNATMSCTEIRTYFTL